MSEIRITRFKNYPVVSRPGPAWRWSYNYTVNGVLNQYGTSLTSLLRRLVAKFPDATIVKTWESNSN